jgi:hypothetical protein
LGYTIPWSWTGFRGNTVWDWLNLLFLPLLLPTLIVPALTPRVMGEVICLDADGKPDKAQVDLADEKTAGVEIEIAAPLEPAVTQQPPG